MSSVQFNQIPSDIRVPGIYIEVNAGVPPFSFRNRLLLIGYKLTAGTAAVDELVQLDDKALEMFGNGSMLAEMAIAARRQAPLQEIWALPLAEPGAGTASTGTITVSGTFPLNRAALLDIYLGGERIRVPVAASDTANTVATNIAAYINAGYWVSGQRALFNVSATVSTNVVTLTNRHKGVTANTFDVSVCLAEDDDLTAKTVLTIAPMSGGAGTPTMAAKLALLGDEPFDTIAAPFTDSQSLTDLSNFLEGRWNYDKQIYGHYVTALYDSFGNLGTFGSARNSPFLTVIGAKQAASPAWVLAAAAGTRIAVNLGGGNRNRPMTGVPLSGVFAKKTSDAFTMVERDSLLRDGISPLTLAVRGREFRMERVITTYQKTPQNIDDITWLDVQTRYLVTFAVRYFKNMLAARYSRATFDEDEDATIEAMKADFIHAYRELINLGVVDNLAGFRSRLRVERDALDPTRINVYLPIDVQQQLYVVAVNATSFLRFARAA